VKDQPLRLLQIGAGSMGSRRLRDLSTRRDVMLALFDERQDRRAEAAAKTPNLTVFQDLGSALHWKPDALSISTPPQHHDEYVRLALDRGLHHFCEANIWTVDAVEVEEISQKKRLISAPSCSVHFLPIVQELSRIVREELGKVYAYQFTLNTYMPDWHPSEGLEYYARNRNTSAGREMVPFELLWLNEVFGVASQVSGMVIQRGALPGISEDTWALQMGLASGACGHLLVMMACPSVLRQGWCFGERGQVFFDLLSGEIRRDYRQGLADTRALGAMKDVLESAYRLEIFAFIDAILGEGEWPQSYRSTAVATATLAAAEASAVSNQRGAVAAHAQPQWYENTIR